MSTTDKIKFVNGSGKIGRGFYAVDPGGNLVAALPGKFKGGGDLKPGWRWATAEDVKAKEKLEADRKAKEAAAQKVKG